MEQIQADINEKNQLARSAVNTQKQSASIRRKLSELQEGLSQLDEDLSRIASQPAAYRLTAAEVNRRGDLLKKMSNRRNELDSLSKIAPLSASDAERADLFSTPSAPSGAQPRTRFWGASETEETQNLANQDLVHHQRTKMISGHDGHLSNLSESLDRTKEVAIAISDELDVHEQLLGDIDLKVVRTTAQVQGTTEKVMTFAQKASTMGLMITILVLAIIDIIFAILPGI
ncbi:MAG: SNARE domain-containing protein [archaeon]|nr:SNARE domain-containing protein [archaeon]